MTHVENDTETIQGAIYIGCEVPPWPFDFEGLLSCEQELPTDTTTINPANTCPMSSIQKTDGELELTFSSDQNKGRMVIRSLDSEIELKDNNLVRVTQLFINDNDYFYIEKNDMELRVNVKNVYVGGCFHELIRWESN